MKKIILLVSSVVLLTSCSKNSSDDANPTQTPTLLTRIQTTKNNVIENENFIYNGSKIVKVTNSNNYETRFTYSGDLISQIESFTNNVSKGSTTYTYTNDKLIGTYSIEVTPTITYRNRTAFTNNTDGSINYTRYTISSSNVETQVGRGKYTIVNGNLTKDEYTSTSYNEIINYTYDTKNNALRNILGIDKIINSDDLSLNNVLSRNEVSNNTLSGGNPYQATTNNTYIYSYNSNNFPTSSIRTETYISPLSPSTTTTENKNYFY